MFSKKLIIQAIRNMPDKMPNDEITEIISYFRTVIGQIYKKRGIESGTQLFIAKKEYTYDLNRQGQLLNEDEFINVLLVEFFFNGGWIKKHKNKFKNLNDKELWRKFDNRACKLLRDSIPISYMEEIIREAEPGEEIIYSSRQHGDITITEYDEFGGVKNVCIKKAKPIKIVQPELQWKKTELPPGEIEIVYEGKIPDKVSDNGEIITGIMAAEEATVSLSEIIEGSHKQMGTRIRESMDEIINELMRVDKKLPSFKEFYESVKDGVYNRPQVFTNRLQRTFKDQLLISRYLIITFPSEENFRAIYEPRKIFLQNLFLKHGGDWQLILARIAIKREVQKKLKSEMGPKKKQIIVKELKEFYRKWLPTLRTEHIFIYAKTKIKKEPKDLDKLIQNFAHILYEELLEKLKKLPEISDSGKQNGLVE